MPQNQTQTATAVDAAVEAPCTECVARQRDRDNNVETHITNWWHCGTCDAHMERGRGGGDRFCECGTEYNAFGQRLRSNWRSNPSEYDEDINDMTGYEMSESFDEG